MKGGITWAPLQIGQSKTANKERDAISLLLVHGKAEPATLRQLDLRDTAAERFYKPQWRISTINKLRATWWREGIIGGTDKEQDNAKCFPSEFESRGGDIDSYRKRA